MLKVVRDKGIFNALQNGKELLIETETDNLGGKLPFPEESANLTVGDVAPNGIAGIRSGDAGDVKVIENNLGDMNLNNPAFGSHGGGSGENELSLNAGGNSLEHYGTKEKVRDILATMSDVPDYEPLPVADVSAIATAKKVIQDIRDGSITPTTFLSRELFCGELAEIDAEINAQSILIPNLTKAKEKFETSFDSLIQTFQGLMSEGEVKKLTHV